MVALLTETHDRGGDRWIAAFTSALKGSKLQFEWVKSLEKSDANYILLMDDQRTWWHSCYQDVLDFIAPYRPLCIGTSMGGYGALMFAEVLGCEAMVFSPQTAISGPVRESIGDDRWSDLMATARSWADREVDLSMSGDAYHIYYCNRHELDKRHAERLDVRRTAMNCDIHAAARVAVREYGINL